MPLLLKACPSFAERWKEHRECYGQEELLYVDLGEFAHHVVDLYNQNQTQEFPMIFRAIERLHIEANEYVKEAAIIGLLEGIQNISGNRGLNPEVFAQYLKPESAKWWRKLNDFWNGKTGSLSGKKNDA